MQKNVASQVWTVFAFEDEGGTNPGEPVTGDAANITANLRLDGGAANAVDDTNPTELEDGFYLFNITQAESNADHIVMLPQSATANVNVIGAPMALYTTPANFPSFALDGSGQVTVGSLIADVITAASINTDAFTNDALASSFVDEIWQHVVETVGAVQARQALCTVLAYSAGVTSGQETTSPQFNAPNSATSRITGTTDGSGNRTATAITPSS